jgi:glycine cleavage system regulatory protein
MKVHEDMDALADLYVARGLTGEERQAVEKHIEDCGPCAERLGQARAFAAWVAGTIAPDAPPDDLEDRIVDRLWEETPAEPRPHAARWAKVAAGIAAAFLFVVIGAVFTSEGGEFERFASSTGRAPAAASEEAPLAVMPPPSPAPTPPRRPRAVETTRSRDLDELRKSNREAEGEKKLLDRAESDPNETADAEKKVKADAPHDPNRPADKPQSDAAPRQDTRKIIRNADLHLEVDAYDAAYTKVAEIVQAEKGFVAGANTQRLANGKMRATVTVRIPPERFEAALARFRELGTVRNQSITTQDVTKAYLDLEARLSSKQALVDRLKKILAEAKGTVKELMEVEVQMGRTIEEIESIKGELKYYDNLVGLSTIILHISEKDLGQPFEYVQTLQANLGLTVRDPEDAYAKAQKAVTDAGGQVVDSRMTRQSDGSAQGTVKARVDAEKFPPLRGELRKLGHVTTDTVNQQKSARGGHGAVKPDAPLRKEQAVLDITISTAPVFVTRKATVAVETAKVEDAYQAARKAVEQAGGNIVDGSLTGHSGGASAVVRAQVDAEKFASVLEALKSGGKVKNATTQHMVPPTEPGGTPPLLRERADIDLSIASPPELIAEDEGLLRTIRDTFSGSVKGILWSIEKLFVGLSLAGPWIALALLVWFIVRRVRRAKAKPAGDATP